MQGSGGDRAAASEAFRDSLFLALVVLLSFVLYVPGLGFYSDDWVFLELLDGAAGDSFGQRVQALHEGDRVIQQRPVQVLYLAGLYHLFGLRPLGYHVVNGAVLIVNAVLLYLVLRRLRLPRFVSLSVPLTYALLPNYSTDRFWAAAFQAPLSIAFYLASLYCLLAAVSSGEGRVAWLAGAALCTVGSVLAYEVTLPLFLLNPALAWYAQRRSPPHSADRVEGGLGLASLLASMLVPLIGVVVFKALVTVRVNVEIDYLSHLLRVMAGAVRLNYGVYGLGLPYVVWWIAKNAADWRVLLASAVVALAIGAYVYRVVRSGPAGDLPRRVFWLRLLGAGLVIFVLGYAVFLLNADITFGSTSLGNRVGIAAALGVALSFVAAFGLGSSLLASDRLRRWVFCATVALVCAAGLLINNTLAGFWQEAWLRQQSILQAMNRDLGPPPPGSILLLDGVCLEHGGAYVFTGQRDLDAVLAMTYRDRELEAQALSHRPRVEPEGLTVYTHREAATYPYGQSLLIYNHDEGAAHPLTSPEAARLYFARSGFDPDTDCPLGFAWGRETPVR